MNIIVAFPKLEDAKGIRSLLMKYDFSVAGVCTSGARALSMAYDLSSCVIVSGYRLADMLYEEMWESMPDNARMLLLTGKDVFSECSARGILCVSMPFKSRELIETLGMLVEQMERMRKKRRTQPASRSKQDQEKILQAKTLLQERNHMTEDEAHRYLQKCSMENGSGLVETAMMVMQIMQ